MTTATFLRSIDTLISIAIQSAFAVTILFVVAAAAALALRNRSAAMRHRLWSLTMLGALVTPALSPLLADWGPGWLELPLTTTALEAQGPTIVQDASDPPPQMHRPRAESQDVDSRESRGERSAINEMDAAVLNQQVPEQLESSVAASDTNAPQPVADAEPTASNAIEPTPLAAPVRFGLRHWFALAWVAGVCVVVARLALSCVASRRLVRASQSVNCPETQQQFASVRRSLGLATQVRLVASERVRVPLTVGVWRPAVVLPASHTSWSREQRRAVLVHELAHIARGDVLWQLVATLACGLYWPQPLVWLAAWRMRVEREYACDDAVLAAGEQPAAYASCLVDVAAELIGVGRAAPPGAVAMAARSKVEQRVRSVLARDRRRNRVSRGVGLVLAAAAGCVLVTAGLLSPAVRSEESADAIAAESNASGPDATAAANEAASNDAADEHELPAETPSRATVRGVVIDASGQPAAGARVVVRTHPDFPEVTADEHGRFEFRQPVAQVRNRSVLAYSRDGKQIGHHARLPSDIDEVRALEPLRIELKPTVAVQIRVTDKDGTPVAGAKAGVLADGEWYDHGETDEEGQAVFRIPADAELQNVYAVKSGLGLDYRAFIDPAKRRNDEPQTPPNLDEPFALVLEGAQSVRVRVVDEQTEAPISGVRLYNWVTKKPSEPDQLYLSSFSRQLSEYTDENGEAVFDWLPTWEERDSLTFWPSHDDYARLRGTYELEDGDGQLTIRLPKLVELGGQVLLPNGNPAAGIPVRVVGDGHSSDNVREETRTGEEGRYRVRAIPNMIYMVVALNDEWGAMHDSFALWPGESRDDINLTLQPTTRVYGRVTLGDDESPIKGFRVASYQFGKSIHQLEDIELPNPEDRTFLVRPSTYHNAVTDEQGQFEFFVGPGSFDIRGPNQTKIQKFEVTDQTELEFNFHSERPEKGPINGRVVDAETGDPVADANVTGIYRYSLAGRDLEATTDSGGEFHVTRELHRTVLYAQSQDGARKGVVEIGPDDKQVTIPIKPVASAIGRLVDSETKQPLSGRTLRYGIDVPLGDDDAPWLTCFGGSVETDGEGRFRLEGLVQGQEYGIDIVLEEGRSWRVVGTVTPTSSSQIELGDLEFSPPGAAAPRPTMKDRVAAAWSVDSIAERVADSKRDAKLGHLRLLFVFADPVAEATEQFYTLRYEDDDVRSMMDDYWLVPIPATGEHADEAKKLAEELGIDLAEHGLPVAVIATDDGEHVATLAGDALKRDGLLSALGEHALPKLDARELLDEALARAKAENKRVFVQETATWCGPCWLLKRFIDRHRETFETDYIFVSLDHRWENWKNVVASLRPGDEPRGIPWSVIIDADGDVLATSDGPKGNIGFPSSEAGIEHFISMLESTSIRLSEDDLAELRDALESK